MTQTKPHTIALTLHYEAGLWWVFDRTRLEAGPFITKAAAERHL